MRAMTEIEWLDGRVTKVPELALGDAFGESVQAELDFGFDDVLEGLWVEVRHHEPDEDSDGDPAREGLRTVRGLPVQPGRTVGPRPCLLHPLRGAAEGLPRRGGAREPFAGLRVVLPHARISLPARRPRGPSRVRSIPLRSGFHIRPRRPRPRRGELGPPCVGTSFRASTASGLWHSPPRPPVPPGRRVSRLRQDDRTYIYVCIPGSGICFGILRHRATPAAHYIATRLHAYRATRRRPAERREGRPWTPSDHALIFERGAVRASRKPSAFAGLFAKLCGAAENPRLRRGTPSAFPRTHCAIINR